MNNFKFLANARKKPMFDTYIYNRSYYLTLYFIVNPPIYLYI